MRQQFYDQKFHCVMCTNPIPPARLRFKSITCSDECKRARKRAMYVQMESKACMFCRKPTTRAEQTLYKRFRAEAAKDPQKYFAAEFKRWTPTDDEKEFTFAVAMRMLDESLSKKIEVTEKTPIVWHAWGDEGPEAGERYVMVRSSHARESKMVADTARDMHQRGQITFTHWRELHDGESGAGISTRSEMGSTEISEGSEMQDSPTGGIVSSH